MRRIGGTLVASLALFGLILAGVQGFVPLWNAPHAATVVNPSGGLAGVSSATAGSLGTGQNWFLSNPPGYQPFIRLDGTASNQTVTCPAFLDDQNIICFQASNAGTAVVTFRSSDAGQTFQAVSQSTVITVNPQSSLRRADGQYLLSGGSGANQFRLTADGLTFSTPTCTNCAALTSSSMSLTLSGTTVLGSMPTGGAAGVGNTGFCRSTTSGTTFTCTNSIPIIGYTGAGTTDWVPSNALIASPTVGTWLALLNRSGGDQSLKIIRSTDDGVTWTEVFNDATLANPTRGIACLTSTLCLAVSNSRIHRSTDAGASWTTVVGAGPDGTSTFWNSIAVFDSLTAVAVPFNTGPTSFNPAFFQTNDGGITWRTIRSATPITGVAGGCPANNGVANQAASVLARNGRAVVVSIYTSLIGGNGPCAMYGTSGAAGSSTSVTGPIGTPWAIGGDGFGPMSQGSALTPFTVAPSQGPTFFNTQQNSAVNTAVSVTINALVGTRTHVDRVEASCSAGTSGLTITDGGTTVWSTLAAEVTAARFRQSFVPKSLTSATASQVIITLASCGAGNTGTLIVHADRY